MSGTAWLLSLHLLSAVLLGAAVTGFWALVLWTRPAAALSTADAGRLNRPLSAAVAAGAVGTLVFGVWLAIVEDAYQVWDGWVIAAIVLWAIAMELGRRAGAAFADTRADARRAAIAFHAAATAVVVALLVLMIWKPGA